MIAWSTSVVTPSSGCAEGGRDHEPYVASLSSLGQGARPPLPLSQIRPLWREARRFAQQHLSAETQQLQSCHQPPFGR